jgi:S-adenosylmethionine:tRNA ribosyltransferase-isomerase
MEKDLFSLDAYQYHLSADLIAQHPCVPRDQSRLLVVDRKDGSLREIKFRELEDLLGPGDGLVFNDTKVIPARLIGQRSGQGRAEVLLVKRLALDRWEVLAKPGKKLKNGSWVVFGSFLRCQVLDALPDGNKIVRFEWEGSFEEALALYGQMPLPPYIGRSAKDEFDETRYQTVYAEHPGAIAAPTAGLHFTEEMLTSLKSRGVSESKVTLHVGLGTFKPVQTDDIRNHPMHAEQFIVTPSAAEGLNARCPDRLQICVGTTCCRTLESASTPEGLIVPGRHETNIFIYPGYTFKYVHALLTNFHLPGSTLLMLTSAFGGYDLIREAYAKAVKDRFRFYSYGDAMLIL